MENASKALFIAAGVFLGTLIITVAVYLFNVFGTNSKDIQEKMSEKQIAEFNNQFLKYYGERPGEGGNPEPIKCTIHDIVSLVNLSRKYSEYDIQINIGNQEFNSKKTTGEYAYSEESLLNAMKNAMKFNTINYKCTRVEYNGQIIKSMTFHQY